MLSHFEGGFRASYREIRLFRFFSDCRYFTPLISIKILCLNDIDITVFENKFFGVENPDINRLNRNVKNKVCPSLQVLQVEAVWPPRRHVKQESTF